MKKTDINIAEILKKLSFLRNNLGLLVPIVIAVVAVLLFLPTRILSGRLRETIQQNSIRTGQQITTLAEQVRDAAPLEAMEEYIDAYARDVDEIDALMARTVYRELLRYDLFHDSNATSIALFERFGQSYRAGIERMIDRLGAGTAPADSEIQAALESAPQIGVDAGREGRMVGGAYGGGGWAGASWSLQTMSDVERGIFEEICTGKARTASVYATAPDLAGYTAWDEWEFENRDKAHKECWHWQLGYWIIEDVVETVRAMNANSQSVLDAPVKRLMNVSFTLQRTGMVMRAGQSRRRTQEVEYPVYVKGVADALTTPCTGRYTDEAAGVDVLHFEVRVVVDESQVLPFIRELCSAKEHKFYGFDGTQPEQTYQHNQITVLETSAAPIEPLHYSHLKYRYGPNQAVELQLICEYVLPRVPAFEEIKPRQVKEELAGVTDEM